VNDMSRVPQPGSRDLRLDVFRGLAMLIILIAHVPDNDWALYIPARFGFSSAAEMFVFCSGLASSFAFGRTFNSHGFLNGTIRIGHRVWQVYWAHLALCMVIMAITASITGANGRDYFNEWGFDWFRKDATGAFAALFTLKLLPPLLNILPMYLALLAMVPVMMALSRVHKLLPVAVSVALWLTVQITGLNLYSGMHGEMEWFFDPFAWQMLFFTGYAFGMGWLPTPRFGFGWLFKLSLAVIVVSIPFNFWVITDRWPIFYDLLVYVMPNGAPTSEHPLRYIHFLATAYVALSLVQRWPQVLERSFVRPVVDIGRQTLQSFQASIVLACVLGAAMDATDRSAWIVALANIAGLVLVWATAAITAFFKSPPWKAKRAPAVARPVATPVEARLFTADVTQT